MMEEGKGRKTQDKFPLFVRIVRVHESRQPLAFHIDFKRWE